MNTENFKKINGLIDNVVVYRHQILEKNNDGNNTTLHDQKNILIIKIECLQSLKQLLSCCMNEYIEQKDVFKAKLVLDIKNKLGENLDFEIAGNLSLQRLQDLDPGLYDLKKYIYKNTEFDDDTIHGEESSDIKNLLLPIPDDLNIPFVNEQFKLLKENLPNIDDSIDVPITPENIGSFLKPDLYRFADEQTIFIVLDEIERLTQKYFFNKDNQNNKPWVRSINFLDKLKKIFEDKKKKFEIPFFKKVKPDIQEKKKKKYEKCLLVTDIFNIPTEKESFESLCDKADEYVRTSGLRCLNLAEKIYERIKNEFPGHSEYAENQLKEIQKKKALFLTPPTTSS